MVFVRPTVLKLLAPPGGYDEDTEQLPFKMTPFIRLLYYTIAMSAIHHTVLFSIDSIGMDLSFSFLIKIVMSVLMTASTLIILLNFFKVSGK